MVKLGAFGIYFLAPVLLWCTKCDVVYAKAGIKCYCTSPDCVSSGENMCTSTLGKCFSQLALKPDLKDIHGCTEQLNSHMRTSCLQNGQGDIISTKKDSGFALMCCTGNLCNYLDSKDRPMSLDIVSGNDDSGNHSNLDPRQNSNNFHSGGKNNGMDDQPGVYYSSRELWFKAAVIAVPIAGGFILIMLVFLAIRMLRHDNQRHRELKHNQSLAKAQLYVTDHFYNPGNKLLSSSCSSNNGGVCVGDEDHVECFKYGNGTFPASRQECVYVSDNSQLEPLCSLQQQKQQLLLQQQQQEGHNLVHQQQQYYPSVVENQQKHIFKIDSPSSATNSVLNNSQSVPLPLSKDSTINAINSSNVCANASRGGMPPPQNACQQSCESNLQQNNQPDSSSIGNSAKTETANNQSSINHSQHSRAPHNHRHHHHHKSKYNDENHRHKSHHHSHHHHKKPEEVAKNYAYEKLRESAGFENPCDSVVVWNDGLEKVDSKMCNDKL